MSAVLSLRAKLALSGASIVLVDYLTSSYAHRRRIGDADPTIESGTRPH